MPICKLCLKSFPNRLKIEGIWRVVNRRKYCLTCSPFKLHNTMVLKHVLSVACKGESKCQFCGKVFIKGTKGNKGETCASCRVNRRRIGVKKKGVDYKGGSCIICGYSKCLDVLSFHHRDPKEKDFNFGGAHCRSWEKVKIELDKCDLLCMNCHIETHKKIRDQQLSRAHIQYGLIL